MAPGCPKVYILRHLAIICLVLDLILDPLHAVGLSCSSGRGSWILAAPTMSSFPR